MPITLGENQSSREIYLEGSVNIADAAKLKQMLIEALSSGQPLTIHLERVTDLDVCILQLLVVAVSEWKLMGIDCKLSGALTKEVMASILGAGFEGLAVTSEDAVLSEV